MVARVDAVGVCYSDAKLVRAGAGHARLRGRDLAAQPVTPGHEVTLTVVAVGERRRGQVRLGGRYILQPDVYYRGRTLAVGYQLAGALAEYVVLGNEVLDGDEGCYLVPLPDEVGAVEGALIEAVDVRGGGVPDRRPHPPAQRRNACGFTGLPTSRGSTLPGCGSAPSRTGSVCRCRRPSRMLRRRAQVEASRSGRRQPGRGGGVVRATAASR